MVQAGAFVMLQCKFSPLHRHQHFDISTNKGKQQSRRDEGTHACSYLIRPVFRPCVPAQTNIHTKPETGHREATKHHLVPVFVFHLYTAHIVNVFVCAHLDLHACYLHAGALYVQSYAF